MQNNGNEQFEKTREIPGVSTNSGSDLSSETPVYEDQRSMFDEETFTDAIVAETGEVAVNSTDASSDDVGGDTAEFTFVGESSHKAEIGHDELSAEGMEGSAREYFNATHSDSIEDKVSELRMRADEGFADEEPSESTVVFDSVEEEKKTKKKKDKKNKKKRGVISDDDMLLLSGLSPEEDEDEDEEIEAGAEDHQDKDVISDEEDENASDEYERKENAEADDDEDEEDEEDDPFIKAFGKSKDKSKDFESMFGNDEPDVEYESKEQNGKILAELRSKAIKATLSVILSVVAAVFCIYFEAAAGTKLAHPAIFEPGKYGVTFAMAMLQIMCVCAIFNLDGLKRAFLGLRPSRPSAEAFSAVSVVVCALHTVLSCIFAYNSSELKTYCSIGCISLVFLSVNTFVKAYTSLIAFCVAASRSPKLACSKKTKDSPEGEAFAKYLDKNTTVLSVNRGDFVSGFFKKFHAIPSVSKDTFKLIAIFTLVSVAAGVVNGILNRDVYLGICTFTTLSLASVPVNALISTALPFLAVSLKAKRSSGAYIGEAACDEYDTSAVISFDDTEVFPPKSVKVSSIKTYEDNRIDKVIFYMARVFDKLKGPLSYVFANSIQNFEDSGVEAVVVEHFSNGISAKIDDKDVLIGTDGFMKLYDIEAPLDNIDESFLQSLGSIMYMAIDGKLAAKFYIKYMVNRGFEPILRSFYDAGICVGIKTLDPCVTDALIAGNLKGTNYPIAVIRSHKQSESVIGIEESVDSAVISVSGVHSFLKNFIRLDNLRNVYRINKVLSLCCSIVGLILSAVLCFTGASYGVGIFFIIIFQLFWCIPTFVFSLISK